MPELPWTHSVRALACAAVVIWHGFLTVVPSDPTDGQRLFSLPLGALARIGVVVFVLLSGYLLGRHWGAGSGRGGFEREGLGATFGRYMARRTWRIVVPYWAALVLVLAAMLLLGLDRAEGSHWDTGLPLTWWRATADFLLISDLVGQVPISHQLWTVPVEYHLYLLAPVVVVLRRRAVVLLAAFALTLGILFALAHFHAPYFLFAFMAAFWAGVRRQTYSDAGLVATVRLLAPVAALSLLLVAVVVAWSPLSQSTGRYFVLDALVSPVFLVWLMHRDVAGRSSMLIRALSWRWLRWLGQRSYSHYLTHAVALEVLWRFAVRPLDLSGDLADLSIMVGGGYLVSLMVAVAFHRAVELPSARRSAGVAAFAPRSAPAHRVGSEVS